jgi:predicted DNA-binding transcriptional regulator YafY
MCAWCELRNDVRHFRTDWVVSTDVLDESFSIPKRPNLNRIGCAAGRTVS